MKREKKERKNKKNKARNMLSTEKAEKNIYDIIGVGADIISGEVKIVIVGDFLVEIHNHNGIVDMGEECIKVNTKKNIYAICGENLKICQMTDEKLDIRGKIKSLTAE